MIAPRRDFAQKSKSQGGTVVTHTYIIERYSQLKYTVSIPEKISICLNRGREESIGNDDVSIVFARKYEMVLKDDVLERKSRRDRLGRFCDIKCAVILRYFFALRVISDILWSCCFESYGLKDTR